MRFFCLIFEFILKSIDNFVHALHLFLTKLAFFLAYIHNHTVRHLRLCRVSFKIFKSALKCEIMVTNYWHMFPVVRNELHGVPVLILDEISLSLRGYKNVLIFKGLCELWDDGLSFFTHGSEEILFVLTHFYFESF
jgi:hypothetical protein